MTATEINQAMAEIALQKVKDCEERLKETPKDNKSERKAIQIELGMYSLCLRAGLLYYTTEGKTNTVQIRKNRFMNISLKSFSSSDAFSYICAIEGKLLSDIFINLFFLICTVFVLTSVV